MSVEHAQACAGLHNRTLEQILIHRRADLRQYACRTGRLPENRNRFGIAAEYGDVVLHPFDCGALIQKTKVRARLGDVNAIRFMLQISMRKEAEHIKSIRHTNYDHAKTCERAAVEFLLCSRSTLVGSAVNPDHDR